MKLALILSNDWELFGDGSGDYFQIQHRPLEDFLALVGTHHAKVTVFAEIGQQWAHQRLGETESWARDIADAWERILKETIRCGSDVQLHLHTQWLNSKYGNGRWQLDFDNWAISSLPISDMQRVLGDGKRYLDSLLRPERNEYECIAFRAGAYCIEPSNVVLQELRRAGILCDSSVTKGLHDSMFYDYRDAYSNILPWQTDDSDVKYRATTNHGLLEIPIASDPGFDSPILRRLYPNIFYGLRFGMMPAKEDLVWLQERNRVSQKRYPMSKRPFMGKKFRSFSWLAGKAVSHGAFQLDYDHLPASVFVRCLERMYHSKTLRKFQGTDVIVPVMASGHVKNMHNVENIRRILEGIANRLDNKVIYWNLQEAAEYCLANLPKWE